MQARDQRAGRLRKSVSLTFKTRRNPELAFETVAVVILGLMVLLPPPVPLLEEAEEDSGGDDGAGRRPKFSSSSACSKGECGFSSSSSISPRLKSISALSTHRCRLAGVMDRERGKERERERKN
jgi:hypothetical protein